MNDHKLVLPPTFSNGSSVISGAAWSGFLCAVAFNILFNRTVFVS